LVEIAPRKEVPSQEATKKDSKEEAGSV